MSCARAPVEAMASTHAASAAKARDRKRDRFTRSPRSKPEILHAESVAAFTLAFLVMPATEFRAGSA